MAKYNLKLAVVATAMAALFALPVASIAGYWNNSLPIVDGASYCAGSSQPGGPGTATVCNTIVPAGPSALTGSELIPADTGLSSGQQPQSVLIDVGTLGAGPTQYSTPLTGATTTIAAGTRHVIINPAGTIAAHTLTFPAASALTEGQKLGFCTTQVVTALTTNAGSGTTLSNAPTAMQVPVATGAASCVEWIYVKSVTTWFRTQ